MLQNAEALRNTGDYNDALEVCETIKNIFSDHATTETGVALMEERLMRKSIAALTFWTFMGSIYEDRYAFDQAEGLYRCKGFLYLSPISSPNHLQSSSLG